jgi:hypothetical protein
VTIVVVEASAAAVFSLSDDRAGMDVVERLARGEALEERPATPVITCDAKPAAASGTRCVFDLIA